MSSNSSEPKLTSNESNERKGETYEVREADIMSRLKQEFNSYDRNVESLSKFKLKLYEQLEDLCKSNTTVESKLDEKKNYEAPIKKPTQKINSS